MADQPLHRFEPDALAQPFDILCYSGYRLEKLRKDPLMLRQVRLDMGYGLVGLMDDARASAERIRVPYLMLHGLGDRIVPQDPVRAAIEVMTPRPDSKLAFYRNGYHLLLRDKEGDKVAQDVVAWIGDHQAALPSGADVTRSHPDIAAIWGSRRTRQAPPVLEGQGG